VGLRVNAHLALCVNISKTVRDTSKVTINDKLEVGYALSIGTKLMTLDDLELLQVRIFSEFRVISQIWEAATAKRMKIDLYCQRQNCSPLNLLFSDPYRLR